MQMHFTLEPKVISGNDVLSVEGLSKILWKPETIL